MVNLQKTDIDKVLTDNTWSFSNDILYDMCRNNPLHNEPNKVAGKFLIIGRTYAAAVERRKAYRQYNSEEFYVDLLVPAISKHSDDIDKQISQLQEYNYLNEENLAEALILHRKLVKILHSISAQDKRSLVSKYLHFHVPNMFYIYDSRASDSIRKYGFNNNVLRKQLSILPVDNCYMSFVVRMLQMQNYIEKKYSTRLNPRQLDRLLLKI